MIAAYLTVTCVCLHMKVNYLLRAVAIHDGRDARSGHYYALVMSGQTRYLCDDAVIAPISPDDVLNASAAVYLCMYLRFTVTDTDNVRGQS